MAEVYLRLREQPEEETHSSKYGDGGDRGQSGMGGSLSGSINVVITPEQGKPIEEDLPVVLMDPRHDDRQAARTLKRRRVEVSFQSLAGTCSSPIP